MLSYKQFYYRKTKMLNQLISMNENTMIGKTQVIGDDHNSVGLNRGYSITKTLSHTHTTKNVKGK